MAWNRPSRANNGKRWDEADDAELRWRAGQGQFLPEMAEAMERSQEAIRTRANILGVAVRSSAGRPAAGKASARDV